MGKIFFLPAVFLLLRCAGSKPQPQAKEGDAEKCAIMQEIRDFAKTQNIDMNQKYPFDNNEKCFCAETIICGGKSTCYSVDCNE